METHQGLLPKKRLRFWWAVVGLIALVVPYIANVGMLTKTVYAAEKTLYKSDRLTVTTGEGNEWQWQSGHDISWKLNFIDKETSSPNWDKVTFKIDPAAAKKAGLTNFTVNGQSWNAKTGELGAFDIYNNANGYSLNLSATSTDDKKRAVSLPIGLVLTQETANTKAVKAEKETKATTTSLLPDDAKMTIQANLYGYEGDDEGSTTPETPGETDPEVPGETQPEVPAPNDEEDPNAYYNRTITDVVKGEAISGILIERKVRTTAGSDSKTNFDNFRIWSNTVTQDKIKNSDDTGYDAPISIYRKANVSNVVAIDGSENDPNAGNSYSTADQTKVRTGYHTQYEQGSSANNRSAYTIAFRDDAAMNGAEFTVVYDHVGDYTDGDGVMHPLGATMKISNIKPSSQIAGHNLLGDMRFIDVPNNLYSGLIYHEIDSLDIELQFFTLENGQFTKKIQVDQNDDAQITFSSLNNFGRTAMSNQDLSGKQKRAPADFTWDAYTTGIDGQGATAANGESWANYSPDKYAETAVALSGVINPDKPETSKNTLMKKSAYGAGHWYSTAHGVYGLGEDAQAWDGDSNNFHDILDGQYFENAALTYPLTGQQYSFRLFTGDGNTWQTISSALTHPIALTEPRKLVTTDDQTYANITADKTGGNLDTKNLAITSTTSGDKFNFTYWVAQKTYDIGTSSLMVPTSLVFEDTLPTDVSLRNGANSVTLYKTDGTAYAKGDYTVNVSGQKVTVTLNPSAIKKVDFNGQDMALKMDVQVDAKVATGFYGDSWDNTAKVTTGLGKDDANKDVVSTKETNKVNVNLKKLPTADVTINKIDEDGNKLEGASFALKKVGEASAWTAASFASAEISAYKDLATPVTVAPTSSDATSWTWNNLPVGEYQLVETAPNGYVGATDVTFTVGATLTANADGTNDVYAATFEETTDPAVLKNVVNTPDTETGKVAVSADVPNQLDIKALFQVKKVDQDNKILPGAAFQYAEGSQTAVSMVADDKTGMHTMKDGESLNFNVLYKLHESTVPAGYDGAEDVYFKVLKNADFATQTGVKVPDALKSEKVLFVKTDKDGKVTEWVKPDRDNNIFTTTFTVQNTKQAPLASIFPVTGGTGIMGIMMLGLAFVGVAGAFTLKRKFSN